MKKEKKNPGSGWIPEPRRSRSPAAAAQRAELRGLRERSSGSAGRERSSRSSGSARGVRPGEPVAGLPPPLRPGAAGLVDAAAKRERERET